MARGADEPIHPVDLHVGRRVQERRVALGLSQTALARAIGVSFQQIQKYEKGSNRISASKLFEIADFMRAEIPFFFAGLVPAQGVAEEEATFDHELPVTRQSMEIARLAQRLSPAKQKVVVQTIKAMMDDADD